MNCSPSDYASTSQARNRSKREMLICTKTRDAVLHHSSGTIHNTVYTVHTLLRKLRFPSPGAAPKSSGSVCGTSARAARALPWPVHIFLESFPDGNHLAAPFPPLLSIPLVSVQSGKQRAAFLSRLTQGTNAARQETSSFLPSHLPLHLHLPPRLVYSSPLYTDSTSTYITSSTYLSIFSRSSSLFLSLTRRRGSEHQNPTRLVTPLSICPLHFFQHCSKLSSSSCLASVVVFYHILVIYYISDSLTQACVGPFFTH